MTIKNNTVKIGKSDTESSWAIGLMTGTVLDGYIDVALLRTDGERINELPILSGALRQ